MKDQRSLNRRQSRIAGSVDGLTPFQGLKAVKLNLHLCLKRQWIPLAHRALPQDLFLAAICTGISHEFDINQCCEALIQLVINQQEQTLYRNIFRRSRKPDEGDEEHARSV
ncbi:hypothetical protein TSMEX_001021 [Taenia solium]|eukprot:TsM_000873300 transcript=TsM_000873300 gene=TsM_000873300